MIEDDMRVGAFPVIEGLVSERLSEQVSAQLDTESGELLLAGMEEQFLLSHTEVQALLNFLYNQREQIESNLQEAHNDAA
jgi:hypothetical protein